jgi:hypothetical protein
MIYTKTCKLGPVSSQWSIAVSPALPGRIFHKPTLIQQIPEMIFLAGLDLLALPLPSLREQLSFSLNVFALFPRNISFLGLEGIQARPGDQALPTESGAGAPRARSKNSCRHGVGELRSPVEKKN